MASRRIARVSDIPEPVDLAVVCVPTTHVPGPVDECLAKGVKAVVVISAGLQRDRSGRTEPSRPELLAQGP